MIKKLALDEFLSNTHIINRPLEFQPKEFDNMSFSMPTFYRCIVEHSGVFIINNVEYNSIIPSAQNLYFFIKESSDVEYLLPFNAVIDIKQKATNEFIVFYYPDSVAHILLRDYKNVKKI